MTNYARLFAEAVEDAVRDDYNAHPERQREGYWQIRLAKSAAWMPARTWWRDSEPGEPDNRMDRRHLAAEIAGEEADPVDVLASRWRRPLTVWHGAGLTIEQEYAYQVAMFRHERDWQAANPKRRVDLHKIGAITP